MNREQFISNLTGWNSYLPLLWEALEATHGDVIELGMGEGSTQKLHDYCRLNERHLSSYESDFFWYKKLNHLTTGATLPFSHKITYVGDNWQIMQEDYAQNKNIGVLFSDEAPGEMRKYNISMFCNTAQIIVAHDSEKNSDHGYKFSLVKPLFKYVKEYEYEGVGAIALSNFIDVTNWVL